MTAVTCWNCDAPLQGADAGREAGPAATTDNAEKLPGAAPLAARPGKRRRHSKWLLLGIVVGAATLQAAGYYFDDQSEQADKRLRASAGQAQAGRDATPGESDRAAPPPSDTNALAKAAGADNSTAPPALAKEIATSESQPPAAGLAPLQPDAVAAPAAEHRKDAGETDLALATPTATPGPPLLPSASIEAPATAVASDPVRPVAIRPPGPWPWAASAVAAAAARQRLGAETAAPAAPSAPACTAAVAALGLCASPPSTAAAKGGAS